jgi:3-oxoacyl-[acyl-carrier protein] reductase
MFTSLEGRSVIVTGASKGIGRGIALRFSSVGCRVLVVSRKDSEAKAVAAEIVAAGGTALGVVADVTRQADMRAMAQKALDAFGAIDVLCANAGNLTPSRLDVMSEEEFDLVMDTNLKGTFLAVSACLPAMQAKKRGRIILTSSITGPVTGYPGWAHYGACGGGQFSCMPARLR